MLRLSAVFIAVCMVLIAGSLGAVLYLAFRIDGLTSGLVALTAFTAMALYNTISSRVRDRGDIGDQIADLSRGTADLSRQVAELSRRLNAMETRVDGTVNRARGASDPLAAEIGELGGLVKELAETVAAHEGELRKRAESSPSAPAASAASAAKPAEAAVTADRHELGEPEGRPTAAGSRFLGMSRADVASLISEAVEANRIDLYLQPIVTLPQRKVRYYEAVSRLRMADGGVVPAGDFLDHAETSGLIPRIDNLLIFRCVQVMRRLQLKNREVGLFCNVSASTLSDAAFFRQFLDFMDANRALASSIIFEFTQQAYRAFGPMENEALAALAERGFRFSMDHVSDLRLEPRELNERSFRFLKVPAKLLLNRAGSAQSDIHPADLADLLARNSIDLVAERIESENTVVDLLDYDVRFGQGFLFSPPRPVRAEALRDVEDFGRAPENTGNAAAQPGKLAAAGGR